MAGAADVEMRAADAETEKKKALLVYKNQQSASDDDEDDEDDEGGRDDNSVDDDEAPAGAGGRRRDPEVEDDDDVDDDDVDDDDMDDEALDEDDGGVRVEKDDDESINAPSDDDLDSTATPRRVDTDDDEDAKSAGDAPAEAEAEAAAAAVTALGKAADGSHSDGDSVSESSRAPSPSPSAKIDEGTSVTLKSGTTTNVNAIIAARRRTGAKKECEACHEPRNGRRALLCANCKCMYHTSCFRKQFSKLVHASGRQWFCPDCEEANKPEEAEAEAPSSSNTPRKGRRDDAPKGRRSAKSTAGGAAAARGKGDADDKHGPASGGGFVSMDLESQRVTEIALRGGKKINTLILERTEEMLQLTKSLSAEIENVMGPTWHNADSNGVHSSAAPNSPPPPPFMLVPSHSSSASSPVETEIDPAASSANGTSDVSEHEVLIRRAHTGLESLKHLLEQLQVSGIQFEVDLIKEIKMPPVRDDHKPSSSAAARKSQAASRANAGATKAKNGASRLYSSKQIQKLEEWYQRSSRPESSEIQAMYRIINCPEYADPELQPDGISVKQIRIWFDNRRAKERLDYMRLKMKDISTADMDAESVKRMKAAYIDEAKEVLEARVSRLRENGKGTGQKIVDEADMLLLGSADRSLPTQKATKSSPAGKGQAHGSASGEAAPAKVATNPKKRIRIDYVASVRKAVKDARESGKSEEEIKALRTSAIERARERLHVPFKNARTGPSKPLGKEEVTHIKLKMLKLLEEDAPADELTDVIELLLSLIIPRDVLIDSGFSRQLELVLKAHKDNKELVRQTTKLMDEFKSIVEQTEATPAGSGEASTAATASTKKKKGPGKNTSLLVGEDAQSLPGTPGISPNSPAASPESRRPRVKFSLEQLVKLEKYFHKEDTPSKKRLDKIAMKLNGIATQDPNSDEAQKSIDYKQIRCWFYKRRSTNQPPQALTAADIHDLSQASSSSDTESDTNEGSPSKARGKGTAASKRKAPSGDAKPAAKRSKKDPSAGGDARGGKKEAKAKEASPVQAASTGKQHPGRIFNVKQLATIIEEYEKNPRPSVARLEELQKVLNQDDHADENVQSALGVTKRQIKTWFSNRRAKERLDLIKMKIKESQGAKAAGEDGSGGSETEDDENETPKKRPASAGKSAPSAETASRESSDAEGRQDGAPLRKRIIVRDDDDDDDDDDEDEDDEDVDMDGDEEGAEEAA